MENIMEVVKKDEAVTRGPVAVLKEELDKTKNKAVPAEPIVNHLIKKAENDPEFAKRILLDNKSLEECFEYVYQEVRKKLNGVSGWIADEEVYEIAETYYILDDVEIEKPKQPQLNTVKKEVTTTKPKSIKTETEKQQLSLFDF